MICNSLPDCLAFTYFPMGVDFNSSSAVAVLKGSSDSNASISFSVTAVNPSSSGACLHAG
jgi:hypothetical protein